MNERERMSALRAILMSGFFSTFGVGLLSFSLPLLSLDARITGAWIGTGFAGYFLARLLAGPVGGMWADSGKARTPLMFSYLCGIFLPLLYFVNPSVEMMFIIQGLAGVLLGMTRPVNLAVLGRYTTGDEGPRWFRLHVFLFNSALFLGPLAGGFIYLTGDISLILIFLFGCMISAAAIVSVGVKGNVVSRQPDKRDDAHPVVGPGIVPLASAVLGRSLGIGLTVAFYPILLSIKLGHNVALVGLLFSIIGLATCVVLPFADRLKKWIRMDVALIGLLLSAVGLYLIGHSQNVWQFAVAGVFVGGGAALSVPETMLLASGLSRSRGKVFGFMQVVLGLGFILGPLAGGLLVQMARDVGLVFMLAGVAGCASLFPWILQQQGKVLVVGAFLLGVLGIGFHSDAFTSERELYRYSQVAMGTVVNLTLEAKSRTAADDGARKAFDFMRSLQQDMDFRNSQGSVGKINASAGRYFVAPSRRVYALIDRAVAVSEASGGVFDPTIGALTTMPMYYALDESIAKEKGHLVDYRRIIFDIKGKRIRLAEKGMALDLGGIAKGAIIDASVRLLKKIGIRAGIVEAGGDFYCFGDRDWRVGIRAPRIEGAYTTVTVREKGVCGSGDYEQFVQFEQDGESVLRHHIIDPSDMEPAAKSDGVTVIAETAELADALATTVFIMGPHRGQRFLQKHYPTAGAMWFSRDLTVSVTDNFPKE